MAKIPHCILNFSNFYISMQDFLRMSDTGHNKALDLIVKLPVIKSFALSTDVKCLAEKKQGHQIHTCSVLKGWILPDRITVV